MRSAKEAVSLPLPTILEGSSFQIGKLHVDPSRNLIESDTDQVVIEPRIMDVLCTLAEHQEEVVTRAELIERNWSVRFGGDESLSRAVSILRKAFNSLGETQFIETIPKRGYRLLQPVRGLPPPGEETSARRVDSRAFLDEASSPTLPPNFSVAVTPIRCMSGRSEEGLAADIGHALVEMLARTPHLWVAAYTTNFGDKLADVEPRELGRHLNVHYLVTGSLERDGDRIKLRVELVDAITNAFILSWKFEKFANHFKADLEKFILDLSTPIVSEIQISQASSAHLLQEKDRDAYEIIQSTEMLRTVYCEDRAREIVDHLEHLLEREPENALAHSSLAVQLAQNVVSAWSEVPTEDLAKANSHITKALKIAPRDADVEASAGIVAFMAGKGEQATYFLKRSLQKNPNNPHALAVLGFQLGVRNADSEGIDMIRAAEKRAPNHPRYPIWAHYRASCLMATGLPEEAIAAQREAIERNPNYHLNYILLATTMVVLNRPEEARAAIATALENTRRYSFDDWMRLLEAFPQLYQKQMSSSEIFEKCRKVWPT